MLGYDILIFIIGLIKTADLNWLGHTMTAFGTGTATTQITKSENQ